MLVNSSMYAQRFDFLDENRVVAVGIVPVFAKAMARMGHRERHKPMAVRLLRQEHSLSLSDGMALYGALVEYYYPEENELCANQN